MIFIGHFLPECILLRLVVNLQPLVRQRVILFFAMFINSDMEGQCDICPPTTSKSFIHRAEMLIPRAETMPCLYFL